VAFGVPDEPYFQEYMVGPLPATNVTKLQPLTYPFNNETPGKTKIPSLTLPGQNVSGAVLTIGEQIADITRELWNTVSASCQ
jgi:primary-amine oxidase